MGYVVQLGCRAAALGGEGAMMSSQYLERINDEMERERVLERKIAASQRLTDLFAFLTYCTVIWLAVEFVMF